MSAPEKTTQPPQAIPKKPTYVSQGQVLSTPPLTARITRATDTIYNILGLYFVSLFSLNPYTSAQNSRFNTRGPGRTTTTGTGSNSRWGSGIMGLGRGSGTASGGPGSGPGSGSGSGSGRPGGRRVGTVDDVRGPECGSCG